MVSPEEANMADDNDVSEERHNFAKLCRLHTELTPTVLRLLFDKFHPPADLSRNLARPEIRAKLCRLKSIGGLTKTDWQTLYPKSQSTSSQYYDCVLLMTLLQNICHLSQPYPNGWDELPLDVDTSISADVARLNYFRNALIKAPRNALSADDYTKSLTWTSNTLFRLTDGQCDGRLYVIDHQPLDEDVMTSYVDLLRQTSSVGNALRDMRPQATSSLAGYHRPSHYFSDTPGRSSSNGQSTLQASSATNSAYTQLPSRANSRLPLAKPVSSAIYETLMESLIDSKNHKDEVRIEQQVLQRYLADITAEVSSDYLLQRLVQSGTLSHQERNKISLCLHHAERIRQALELVGRKAGNAFAVFCGILRGRHKVLSENIVAAKDELLNKDPPDPICLANQEIRVQYLATISILNPVPWYGVGKKAINEYFVPPCIIDKFGVEQNIDDVIKQSRCHNQPMRILIEGSSGVGKTVLCTHLVHEWAKGDDCAINRYKLVLFVDLTRMRNGADLSEVIMQQCLPPSTQFSTNEMSAIMESHSADVLFILDGYERLTMVNEESSPLKDPKFEQCSFLVTIVNRFATTSLRQILDANYFLLGVHDTSLPDLLDNYVHASNTPIDKYHYMFNRSDEDKRFTDLLRIPLYFYCTCLVCEVDGSAYAQTATSLLQGFMKALQKLHNSRQQQDTPGNHVTGSFMTIIRRLEKFAFRQMMTNTTAFSQEEPISQGSEVALAALVSFYETEGPQCGEEEEQEPIASFRNGILREYLAACYLSRNPRVLREHVELLVTDVRFHKVCAHVFGLLRCWDNKPLVQCLCTALADGAVVIGQDEHEFNDLARFQLPLQCVNECNTHINTHMDEERNEDIYSCVVDNFDVIHKCDNVEVARTTYSLNSQFAVHGVHQYNHAQAETIYKDESFDNDTSKILANETLHNGYRKVEKSMENIQLCVVSGKIIGEILPSMLTITNGYVPLDAAALHGLAHLLRIDVTRITELDIQLDSMGDSQDDAIEALASAVGVNTRVTKLILRWSAAHLLARFLTLSLYGNISLSQLVMLDGSRCTKYFASATVRDDLRLACNMMQRVTDVRFHGCSNSALVSALLRQLPCSLRRLSLSECRLDVVASRDLARHVERTQTLLTLNLSRIDIKRPNFHLIADCLARNCCINTVILNGVILDSEDVTSLAEALRLNYTLARIDLSNTTVNDSDLQTLSVALRDNTTVSHLSITGCNVSDNAVFNLSPARGIKIIK